MAKGEERLDLGGVIVAIPHKEPLAVPDLAALTGKVERRGHVLVAPGPGADELAGRILVAGDERRGGVPQLHPGQPDQQHGVHLIDPRGHLDRAADVEHHDAGDPELLAARGGIVDQGQIGTGQIHVGAICALAAVDPRRDDGGHGAGRDHAIVHLVIAKACLQALQQRDLVGRGHPGTASAGRVRRHSIITEHPDGALADQRQGLALVLQQHRALLGDRPGHPHGEVAI